MYPDLLRKTAWATAVVLPLAFVSCNRQSAESKQPVVEHNADAANSAVGTTGTSAPPSATAGSDAAIERDPDAIKALADMSCTAAINGNENSAVQSGR